MTAFIHPWAANAVRWQVEAIRAGEPPELDHTAGSLFRARGVTVGDVVYVVSWSAGAVNLHGRLTVGTVTSQAEAKRTLGRSNLWPAPDHLIAKQGSATPFRQDVAIAGRDIERVRFVLADGTEAAPAMNRHGRVDHQAFRAVRPVTVPTARRFDSLLGLPPT
jgi:hypothetical protein